MTNKNQTVEVPPLPSLVLLVKKVVPSAQNQVMLAMNMMEKAKTNTWQCTGQV